MTGKVLYLCPSPAFARLGEAAIDKLAELGELLRAPFGRNSLILLQNRAIGRGQVVDQVGASGLGQGGFRLHDNIADAVQHRIRRDRAQGGDSGIRRHKRGLRPRLGARGRRGGRPRRGGGADPGPAVAAAVTAVAVAMA